MREWEGFRKTLPSSFSTWVLKMPFSEIFFKRGEGLQKKDQPQEKIRSVYVDSEDCGTC